ncbi:hypothetical protein AWB78_08729 [Caballeronia calidae]|uniref:Uncharacterized protein n=1 Tax=Caballeronia calidae TaxID=1777139 RepID=A0A158EL48_9BURK|nr:hypothetical protein AWB78_08655 [Caballeronia calidae]SAL07821.1 hypothetical protein AWB78_08729 [Caballeronia calidae]
MVAIEPTLIAPPESVVPAVIDTLPPLVLMLERLTNAPALTLTELPVTAPSKIWLLAVAATAPLAAIEDIPVMFVVFASPSVTALNTPLVVRP